MFLTHLFRYQLLRSELRHNVWAYPSIAECLRSIIRGTFVFLSFLLSLPFQYNTASHEKQTMDVNNLQGIERPGFHVNIHVTRVSVIIRGPGMACGCYRNP